MAISTNGHGHPQTCSGGGPVIVIPAELAHLWRGTLPPLGAVVPDGWTWGASGGPICDYDRACDPTDRQPTANGGFASLAIGPGQALILDGELVTTFLPHGPGAGILTRGDSDEQPADPAALPESAWRDCPLSTWTLTDGRLFMFDSAFAGDGDPARIAAFDGVGVIDLGPGRYQLTVASDPHEVDYVRIHRVAAQP